ncbi:MAG: hypothetical protein RL720_560 [Actinomycetota bacterium]
MTNTVTLASELDSADLKTFLERAERLGCEHIWLVGAGNALAAYVAVLTPQGLLDVAPTVLGLRVFERVETESLDMVVQVRAMLDRLAHDPMTIPLPVGQAGIAWTGVAPPRAGWASAGTMLEIELQLTAKAGIEEVAKANGLGTNIVTTVREEVWRRPLNVQNSEAGLTVPAGVAFAGFGLGFFDTGIAQVTTSGAWTRVATARGHILIK